MVKLLISILILCSYLNAGEVIEAVKGLLGNKYYQHRKIINVIFRNENAFYRASYPDISKIAAKLKANGLLNLYFSSPKELTISLAAKGEPLLFLKTVNESLHDIGYSFFTTKEAKREGDYFHWKIVLKSESAIDPELFAKELYKRGIFIQRIQRKNLTYWEYDLDLSNAQILAKALNNYKEISLRKPLDDYWFKIDIPSSMVEISSHINDNWHPYVIFYDSSLKMLGYYTNKEKEKRVKLQIPADTRYIKISDYYSLSNIKRGLRIRLYQ